MKKTNVQKLKNAGRKSSRNSTKMTSAGITLIALVITIIVLLILAGVAISMLSGDNGILNQATRAKTNTEMEGEKESIQLVISEILIDKASNNDNTEIKRNEIEEILEKNISDKDVEVSPRREGEEYVYIVKIGENEYGIKESNEVEGLPSGIRNQYIEITEATEANPKYIFKNTIRQEDIDAEANTTNTQYEIVGISNQEDGTYVLNQGVEGLSGAGILNITDIENATFEYTLNDFMLGDEVFYVKIKIGDNLEKIQKLTILQGDVVRYEECFAGITYTGTWNNLEDENCSGGKAKYTETIGDKLNFICLGKTYDLSVIATEDTGKISVAIKNESGAIIKFTQVGINNDGTKDKYTKISDIIEKKPTFSDDSIKANFTITNMRASASGNTNTIIIDAIWIYK